MKNKVYNIQNMHATKAVKIKLLKELLSDCQNEMDAQEQNMHPEVEHNLAECYRVASDYLREIQNKKK